MIDRIARLLGEHGLILRGGFHPTAEDDMPDNTRTLLLVGNAGSALWGPFSDARPNGPDPMDVWTRGVLGSIADRAGARALYPFDGPPYHPFQRWAQRAESVYPSPILMLIHPDYGLWHAYRGALAFREELPLPEPDRHPSPCDSCADKPCLSRCPATAFKDGTYDVAACAAHVTAPDTQCRSLCQARAACPVGTNHRYRDDHGAFHMDAFIRARD